MFTMTKPKRRRFSLHRRAAPPVLLAIVVLATVGCLNHYQIHPKRPPVEVVEWQETTYRGKLMLRMRGAKPFGPGPFPTVIVHPEANHEAREMRGIVRSLALRGYLAVAVDYKRLRGGIYRGGMFNWRDPEDPRAAFDVVRARPDVDPTRIGTMGYSQGGIFSLLIAANTGGVKAVVAYYPLADFNAWLDDPTRRGMEKLVFKLINRGFRRFSGTETEEEFRALMDNASPLEQVDRIDAPVLLIHGDRDTSASSNESEKLADGLHAAGKDVELMIVEDAGHVFNFKNESKAQLAWDRAASFLDRHLKPR